MKNKLTNLRITKLEKETTLKGIK